ncbi:MAG: 4Fe-4S dicluster domain-containing protein [Anaerolineaceae bacterium]|nr:MAG: 4Fe-4S dicluster domain-containing protein [Anaerolineaceae bacterium]
MQVGRNETESPASLKSPAMLRMAERRRFLALGLKITGLFLGGSLLSLTPARRAAAALAPVGIVGTYPYRPHYAMVIRQKRCTGCESCVEACIRVNNVAPYGYRIAVLSRAIEESLPTGGREFMPVLCNQCNKAPCVRVCPTKATYKDKRTGIVLVDEKRCIGCKACMLACPYNARYYNEAIGAADKCDFCFRTRLQIGKGIPACVEACPVAALVFGDLSAHESEIHRILHEAGRTIYALRPEKGTLPSVFYIME